LIIHFFFVEDSNSFHNYETSQLSSNLYRLSSVPGPMWRALSKMSAVKQLIDIIGLFCPCSLQSMYQEKSMYLKEICMVQWSRPMHRYVNNTIRFLFIDTRPLQAVLALNFVSVYHLSWYECSTWSWCTRRTLHAFLARKLGRCQQPFYQPKCS
jgi:hypothetical protein